MHSLLDNQPLERVLTFHDSGFTIMQLTTLCLLLNLHTILIVSQRLLP